MRFFAYVSLAVLVAAGCGETAPAATPFDQIRDASVPNDGAPDGGTDLDGSAGDGGSGGGTGGSSGSWCITSALCPSCPDQESLCNEDTPCPVGEVCLLTGCEDFSRCFTIGGGACEIDADCGDSNYECNDTVARCLRTEPGCTDSNDCVAGFACESGACVDRRLPCTGASECPHGYRCFFAAPDQRFCRRITRPCADDVDCLVLGVPCGDADRNGTSECMPPLLPTEFEEPISCDDAQCPNSDAPVCEPIPEGTGAACGRFGPCALSAQCAPGLECKDLWGDGRSECVLPGGSCVDSSECSPRSLCATPRSGQAPACIGAESM